MKGNRNIVVVVVAWKSSILRLFVSFKWNYTLIQGLLYSCYTGMHVNTKCASNRATNYLWVFYLQNKQIGLDYC